MQLFCIYTIPYTAWGCICPLSKQQSFILHLLNKNVRYKWDALQVRKGVDAGRCSNMHYPRNQMLLIQESDLAPAAGIFPEVHERGLQDPRRPDLYLLFALGGGDCPRRCFFHIGENTYEKAIGELLGSNPRVAWQSWRVQAGFGIGGCASRASNIFNISWTADVSKLRKRLHMYGNRQALWSSEMRLKKKNYMVYGSPAKISVMFCCMKD